jgi:hypothetical protein
MKYLRNLLTGETFTRIGDKTLVDTQGNVYNRFNRTWNDGQGNFILPIGDKTYADRNGDLFTSFGDDDDEF